MAISTIRLDLLELFGSGYVMEHCVSAFLEHRRNQLYQTYITDALKEIGKLNMRFEDWFKPEETRTAKEIINGIRKKLGG